MPHRTAILLYAVVCSIGLSASAFVPSGIAQIVESFDDGDFDDDPPWYGDTHRWTIGELDGPALQSNGAASADTIHLATPSKTAYGTWRFTVAHHAVNVSSFNGIRIFLTADRSDVTRQGVGYYLQLGTNNADVVSLWRSDGSLSTQRVELGRSEDVLVAGDSSLLSIVVERDAFGRFRVFVDGALVVSALDNRHTSSDFFAVWVKHTSTGAQSFVIDDVLVTEDEPEDMGPVPRRGEIVINELLFDPLIGHSEFIELHNRGQVSFDLRHLHIRDAHSDDVPVSFTPVLINPGGYAVLVEDSASFRAAFEDGQFTTVNGWPSLNNGGDTVVLSGPDGVLDSLAYDAAAWVRGLSMERIDPDGPTETDNFTSSVHISGSTPSRINSVYSVDERAPSIRFVEQTGPAVLDLHFDEPVVMDDLSTASVLYPTTAVELVKLSDTAVRIQLAGPPTSPSIGIGHVRDRKGNRAEGLTQAISFAPMPGDLAFSEIMFEPLSNAYDGRPDQLEFIEMVNVASRQLSLSQLMRTRNVNEFGDADTLRFGAKFAALMPGAYLVISAGDSTDLRTAFPAASVEYQTVYVSAPSLTLTNGGDRVRIHNGYGLAIADVAYDPQWHHPDLAERRGVSLERIDLGAASNDPASWSSSTFVDGATPGAPNSIRIPPAEAPFRYGLSVDPSPFSPDGDGHDDATAISYRVPFSAPNIRVRIYDVDGFEVRALQPAGLSGPQGRIIWDGRDDSDRALRIGIYIVVFEAVDGDTRRSVRYKRSVVLARRLK